MEPSEIREANEFKTFLSQQIIPLLWQAASAPQMIEILRSVVKDYDESLKDQLTEQPMEEIPIRGLTL